MKILFKPTQFSQQRQREKERDIYPILLAMYATFLRNLGHEIIWDKCITSYDKIITSEDSIDVDFLDLPHPDRHLTNAFHPKYQKNGNFKYHPATYIQSALDCWYRGCNFCRWAKKYPYYKVRSVETMLREVAQCRNLGFKELFDDSGTFPKGQWLLEFTEGLCQVMNKVRISCNMRLDYWHPNLHGLRWMRKAGFRMLLYGLESANQDTLDRLNKGINIDTAINNIKRASKAGLEPHIAVMFGYPWETEKDAEETLKLVHYLLRKGYAKTVQASFYVPFNGEGKKEHHKYVKRIYKVGYDPRFWFNRLISIRNINDIRYLWRGIREAWSK